MSTCIKRLKRCLRYVNGTKNCVFIVGDQKRKTNNDDEVLVWSDSNWMSPKSTSGWMVCWNGMTLMTASKTQSTTALSSAEAEIIAGTEAAKEGRYAANLLSELEGHEVGLVLFCDASAAIGFASRPGLGRVKHLNLRHLWIQEEMLANGLKIKEMRIKDN